MTKTSKTIRVQQWVVSVGIVLFLLKILAYYLTHSVAILTDALESTVNVVTGFTGLYSLRLAARPKDGNHPYGHGKIELISASFEGILIVVAGLIILYESLVNLLHAHPVAQLDAGIALISITAIANYAVGIWCIRTARAEHSLALEASGKHLQADAWTSVGIIVGLILLRFTNVMWIDSAVAILFSLLILVEGGKMIRKTVAGITDEANEALLSQLITALNRHKQPNWIDLHNLRVIQYGSVFHLDCHLTVPWYFNVQQAHDEVEALNQRIVQEFHENIEMFVHTDACSPPVSCSVCVLEQCPVRQAPFQKRLVWTLENVTTNARHEVK